MNYSKTLTFSYNEIKDFPFFKNYKVYLLENGIAVVSKTINKYTDTIILTTLIQNIKDTYPVKIYENSTSFIIEIEPDKYRKFIINKLIS
jgi:hypothetical protein